MTTAPTNATNTNNNTTTTTTSDAPTRSGTHRLLYAGAAAGPLWAIVALAQAAAREGYDLTRHPLSALANGELGWLQIGNFVVAGLLFLLGGFGLARALRGAPGGRWAPRLVGVAGLGMIAAGILVMDPADGFPLGTPAGMPAEMSWHSYGHLVAGTVTFGCLIAACYVLGHHFRVRTAAPAQPGSAGSGPRRTGHRGAAVAARTAGTALLVGNAWAMAGGRAGSLTLAIGAITAMLWVSYVAARLARSTARPV